MPQFGQPGGGLLGGDVQALGLGEELLEEVTQPRLQVGNASRGLGQRGHRLVADVSEGSHALPQRLHGLVHHGDGLHDAADLLKGGRIAQRLQHAGGPAWQADLLQRIAHAHGQGGGVLLQALVAVCELFRRPTAGLGVGPVQQLLAIALDAQRAPSTVLGRVVREGGGDVEIAPTQAVEHGGHAGCGFFHGLGGGVGHHGAGHAQALSGHTLAHTAGACRARTACVVGAGVIHRPQYGHDGHSCPTPWAQSCEGTTGTAHEARARHHAANASSQCSAACTAEHAPREPVLLTEAIRSYRATDGRHVGAKAPCTGRCRAVCPVGGQQSIDAGAGAIAPHGAVNVGGGHGATGPLRAQRKCGAAVAHEAVSIAEPAATAPTTLLRPTNATRPADLRRDADDPPLDRHLVERIQHRRLQGVSDAFERAYAVFGYRDKHVVGGLVDGLPHPDVFVVGNLDLDRVADFLRVGVVRLGAFDHALALQLQHGGGHLALFGTHALQADLVLQGLVHQTRGFDPIIGYFQRLLVGRPCSVEVLCVAGRLVARLGLCSFLHGFVAQLHNLHVAFALLHGFAFRFCEPFGCPGARFHAGAHLVLHVTDLCFGLAEQFTVLSNIGQRVGQALLAAARVGGGAVPLFVGSDLVLSGLGAGRLRVGRAALKALLFL